MPLQFNAPPFIDRPVRPLRRGPYWIQRVQRYLTHYPEQDRTTGEVKLTLRVYLMHFYTNPDGSVGEDASEVEANRELTYIADNKEIIDLATGEIVYTRDRESNEVWAAKLAADPRPLAERGNAFGHQLYTLPTETQAQQIAEAMDAADGPPWYRFGRDVENPAN